MYKPEYKGPIHGWAINHARANLWRIEATNTWDDIEQEAYITFLRCVKKCPECQDPKQFMALFKRAFMNQVNDLATTDTKFRSRPSVVNEGVGETDNDGYLAVLIKEAPAEVKAVLNLFLNAPVELLDLALDGWRSNDKRCSVTRSRKICKMLGLDPSIDVLRMVEDHFLE